MGMRLLFIFLGILIMMDSIAWRRVGILHGMLYNDRRTSYDMCKSM
jgi:hypothetical protein